jgi:hypothetical protein
MKQFNKTILAVALMAAAGSASAALSVNNGASELYMSAYDSTSGNTYSFNTGLTLDTLDANLSNTAYTASFDLSTDTNWTSSFLGAGTFNAATTTYGLLVSSSVFYGFLSTSSAVGGLPLAGNDISVNGIVSKIANHALDINSTLLTATSGVVNDGDTADTGQFNNFNTLFGSQSSPSAMVAGAYGSSLGFYKQVNIYDEPSESQVPAITPFAGKWTLSGNTLAYNVAAVPLPAAVWMFGAGLMGLLGLNRRKSMAV